MLYRFFLLFLCSVIIIFFNSIMFMLSVILCYTLNINAENMYTLKFVIEFWKVKIQSNQTFCPNYYDYKYSLLIKHILMFHFYNILLDTAGQRGKLLKLITFEIFKIKHLKLLSELKINFTCNIFYYFMIKSTHTMGSYSITKQKKIVHNI